MAVMRRLLNGYRKKKVRKTVEALSFGFYSFLRAVREEMSKCWC